MIGWLEMRYLAVPASMLILCIPLGARAGADVEFSTRLTISNRSGYFASAYASEDAPTDAQHETGFVSSQLLVSPDATLILSTKRLLFQASYQLELSNRILMEDQFSLNFLHRPQVLLRARLSRIITFSTDTAVRMALLDYTSAMQENFSQEDLAANLPEVQELRFVTINSTTVLSSRISRNASVNVEESYVGYIPYGSEVGETLPLSTQHQNALQVAYLHQLTKRNSIKAATSAALVLNSPGSDFVPVQATLAFDHVLSMQSNLQLAGGIMMAHQLEIDQESVDEPGDDRRTHLIYWLPEAGLIYNNRLILKNRRTLTTGITVATNGYFHRATASIRQRLFFNLLGVLRLSSKWGISAQGMVSSLIAPEPTAADDAVDVTPIDYPTIAVIELGARYELSREFSLRFGVTTNARWVGFGEDDFRARAFEEFVFHLTLTAEKSYLE